MSVVLPDSIAFRYIFESDIISAKVSCLYTLILVESNVFDIVF